MFVISAYVCLPTGLHDNCTTIQLYSLCRTMPCFHVISISLIFGGHHPCAHYILWRLPLCALLLHCMTSQWVTMLLGMPHYGITMGNDIARVMMLLCVHHNAFIYNDIAMNLVCYVLLCQIMILLFHQ